MKVEEKLKQVPKMYKGIFRRVFAGSKSRKDAIHAFCLECMGYVRTEVKKCDTVTCPLFNFKPY